MSIDYDLLNVAPAGFFSFDDSGQLVAVNDTLLDLLGFSRDQLMGSHVEGILGIAGRIFYQTHLFPLIRMHGRVDEIYVALRSSAGEKVPVLLNAKRVEADGQAVSHCVAIRVKERKKYEDELLRAKKAAERAHARELEANKAKSHYLHSVSHEIRTPINALLGYADLLDLSEGKVMGDEQLTYVSRVRQVGRHLLVLVTDILDLAKIESGAMAVKMVTAEIADAADAAFALVEPQALEGDIRLLRSDADASGAYCGDRERVVQILVNLLSNALKFTDPGGRVEIDWTVVDEADPEASLDGNGPWLRVRVSDTGIGIPPEGLDKLFQPFSQVREPGRDAGAGSGLGLTISRELARLMLGDITVVSEPGFGSTFTLWLRSSSNSPQ